jgi:ABC-type glycerol-3-phosphate transport system substrate-binding protein
MRRISLFSLFVIIVVFTLIACSDAIPETGHEIITFVASQQERQFYESLMQDFHKENPNITVQFVPLPDSTVVEDSPSENY